MQKKECKQVKTKLKVQCSTSTTVTAAITGTAGLNFVTHFGVVFK